MLGRWQPWHDGHQALFQRCVAKTGQVIIQVRDVQGASGGDGQDDNPFDWEAVCKNIEDGLAKDRNHIYIKDKKVVFIRNVYKTAKTYGQKKNIIAVKKFVEMVKDILGEKDKTALFSKKNGSPIAVGAIGSYFRKYMLMSLTESEIMKIVLKHIDEAGSYDMLRRVAQNRGTSVATLLKEYDISFVKDEPTNVITQNQDVKQDVNVEVAE